jgi:hypothetical protein
LDLHNEGSGPPILCIDKISEFSWLLMIDALETAIFEIIKSDFLALNLSHIWMSLTVYGVNTCIG